MKMCARCLVRDFVLMLWIFMIWIWYFFIFYFFYKFDGAEEKTSLVILGLLRVRVRNFWDCRFK